MPDPFDILGLPARFDLDGSALHRAWLAGSARLHPDRPGQSSEPDTELAQKLAELAALNRAKSVLADPIQRAEALLERLGGGEPSKESDKSLPEGFLLDMLEVREQVEQAAASRNLIEMARLEVWAGQKRQEAIETVRGLFAAHTAGDRAALVGVRREINAWRYIERLIEQLPLE
ncbi:MAG: iron-sulfur cluster co-chaperone HscB C-terminal domain-containing protein [Phycisphaerales bacterium]